MNIMFLNTAYQRQITFCAENKKNTSKKNVGKDLFSAKQELTPIEEEFNVVLRKYNTALQNVISQKELLKSYYSAQDKFDYKLALKEKNSLTKQLKQIAERANSDYIKMEMDIASKKFYNRYIPKIYRAETSSQLDELQKIISKACIIKDLKTRLLESISERRRDIVKTLSVRV